MDAGGPCEQPQDSQFIPDNNCDRCLRGGRDNRLCPDWAKCWFKQRKPGRNPRSTGSGASIAGVGGRDAYRECSIALGDASITPGSRSYSCTPRTSSHLGESEYVRRIARLFL